MAGSEVVDREVQTGLDDEDLVQISTTLQELMLRIRSFQQFKRYQLDISNQVEFCCNHDAGVTCARTDATLFRRSPYHDPVKMQNKKGPLGKRLEPLERFQRSLYQDHDCSGESVCAASGNLLHLPKRIFNIEQYLGINQGNNRPKDLLARVAQIEMRLLAIEGQSYEYDHAKVGNKSVPQS